MLFGPAGHRGHGVTKLRQQCDCHTANAARCTRDDYWSVVGAHAASFEAEHAQHRGESGGADPHCLLARHRLGSLHEPVGLHPLALAIATPVTLADCPAGEDHAITCSEAIGL